MAKDQSVDDEGGWTVSLCAPMSVSQTAVSAVLAIRAVKPRFAIAPRFSLRFLLAAVTAFSGYLAWERSYVMERRAACREWNAAGALLLTPEQASQWPILLRAAKEQARVSFVRRMLGDEPIQLIHFPQDFEPSTNRAATLFPEAETFRGGYVF